MDPRDGRLLGGLGNSEQISPLLPEISAEMERLAACIQEAVQQKTHNGIANLTVHIRAGKIILAGRCTTYYLKQLAQHAAMTASGRNFIILNHIDVELQ
ncbi:MAG: hypothetical protein NZ602_12255 [Thermoguttaceae bacterium]|nr:hypothetical protein [Thermoguttaceae bacterium]